MSSSSLTNPDMIIEDLLYGESLEIRDLARSQLQQGASKKQLKVIIHALQSQQRITRRRVTRFLSDMPSHRILPLLIPFIETSLTQTDLTPKVRREALEYAVRILTTLSEDTQPVLQKVILDHDPKVRLSCITPIADDSVLMHALQDDTVSIVHKAAERCIKAEKQLPSALIESLFEKWPDSDVFFRLYAQQKQNSTHVQHSALQHNEIALSYITHYATLNTLVQEVTHRVAAMWALNRVYQQAVIHEHHQEVQAIESLMLNYVQDPNPEVRMAIARTLPMNHLALHTLVLDSHQAVAWLAKQAQQGSFNPHTLLKRLGEHARLELPSAHPPYGLRSHDHLIEVPRMKAALALCHTRFDVNMGVAMRSAEAAGLEALYLMGESKFSKRPTRGAELAIPLHFVHDAHHLIYQARVQGYQIVAVQQTPDSQPYHQANYPPNPLFVLGSEDAGLPDSLRTAADLIVEIPLYGLIDSLNVASAATCVIMHWRTHCPNSSTNL